MRVRCLAQGHLDTQIGGARDQTSNLAVTSQTRSTLSPQLLFLLYDFYHICRGDPCDGPPLGQGPEISILCISPKLINHKLINVILLHLRMLDSDWLGGVH